MCLFNYSRQYLSIMDLFYLGVPIMCINNIYLAISWIITAVSNNAYLTLFAGLLHSLGGAMVSSLHTVTTSLLCKPQYGGVYLGYMVSADGLARILCPLLTPSLYDISHSLPYWITCGLGFFECLICFLLHYQIKDIAILKRLKK